jgi:hypothetical protein
VLANDVLKSFTPSRNQINFSFGGRGGGSWEERFSRYVNTNVSKQLKKKDKKDISPIMVFQLGWCSGQD